MRDLLFRLCSNLIELSDSSMMKKSDIRNSINEARNEIKYNIKMISSLFGLSSVQGQNNNNDDLLTKYNNLIVENKKLREQYNSIRSCIDAFQPRLSKTHKEDKKEPKEKKEEKHRVIAERRENKIEQHKKDEHKKDEHKEEKKEARDMSVKDIINKFS